MVVECIDAAVSLSLSKRSRSGVMTRVTVDPISLALDASERILCEVDSVVAAPSNSSSLSSVRSELVVEGDC